MQTAQSGSPAIATAAVPATAAGGVSCIHGECSSDGLFRCCSIRDLVFQARRLAIAIRKQLPATPQNEEGPPRVVLCLRDKSFDYMTLFLATLAAG